MNPNTGRILWRRAAGIGGFAICLFTYLDYRMSESIRAYYFKLETMPSILHFIIAVLGIYFMLVAITGKWVLIRRSKYL